MSRDKKYNVERGLITKLIETKDISTLKDKQIKAHYFTGEFKKIVQFIEESHSKGKGVPTVRALKQKFPKFEFEQYIDNTGSEVIGTEEPLTYWCDEVRKKVQHNKLADALEKSVQSLENDDLASSYLLMKKTILYMESETTETTSKDITQDTSERRLAYLTRKEQQGIIGIPSGFEKLDWMLKGTQDSTLTTMIASTGIGKTWFEVLLGAHAQLNGYKVLHCITEMSESAMLDRYEAILIGKYDDFNYSRFKSGMLNPAEEDLYFDFLENRLPNLEPLIIEDVTGVSSLASKIEQHNPDLILIDGAYLMEDDQGAKEDWLRVAHITRDLKLLAKRIKKPIFINSQADSVTSKKTGPELENIGYSKAIGQDSDVVLALFQDSQMREDKEMKIKILKQREGMLGNVVIEWDFDRMKFNSIYASDESSTDSHSTSTPQNKRQGVLDIE